MQLIRKGDDDSLFRTAAAGVGKVVLCKLAWSVPVVQPNDVWKVNLYKSIASNNVIPVSFRMHQFETFTVPQATSTVWLLGVSSASEKPQWVLIGLQTDKSGSQVKNAALFDHCNLTNMQVMLNHSKIPSMHSLSVIECSKLKAMDRRCLSYSRRDSQLRWSTV